MSPLPWIHRALACVAEALELSAERYPEEDEEVPDDQQGETKQTLK